MRTPFLRRETGSLTNRTVTVRTIPDFKHPRTGFTALLLLSATTELLVIDLIAQLFDPSTAVKVEGINYFADTLLFAGAILGLASATPRAD